MNPAEPRPPPASARPSHESGASRAVAGRRGLAVPDRTATTSSRETPPRRSSTSTSGVPSSNSPTPARGVQPLTVQTIVPGDSAVPNDRKSSGPSSTMRGTLARVSTLFTSDTGCPSSTPARYGRRDAWEGRATVDHLEQGGLLPQQVAVGGGDALDGCALQPARLVELRDGGFDPGALGARRSLHADDDPIAAHDVRGDERALEHLVGVAAQERAVLQRAGLALGRVHHQRHRATLGLLHDRLPLLARGEPRPAAAAQARGDHRVDDGGRFGGPGRLERSTAARPLVVGEGGQGASIEDPTDLGHRRARTHDGGAANGALSGWGRPRR